MIDFGEPVKVPWVFPAESATENELALSKVETIEPPPAAATDLAFTVHSADEV